MFPSPGEINFRVEDAYEAVETVLLAYRPDAHLINTNDSVSLMFDDWRFNLRRSNTVALLRLNVEARDDGQGLSKKVADILKLLGGTVV